MVFYDRRGRFARRRLAVGLLGTVLGFLLTAVFSYLFLSEPQDDFIHPSEPGPVTTNSFIHCFVLIYGNYTANVVKREKLSITQTWGKQCSSLFFVGDARTNRWKAWLKAIEKGKQTAAKDDWMVLTGLGTYIVMDNLRKMVQNYTHTDTSSFVWTQEYPFKTAITPHVVISYMGIQKLYAHTKRNIRCISRNEKYLHILYDCLTSAGFVVADNRDVLLRHRIIPYSMSKFLRLSSYRNENDGLSHTVKPGIECCSRDLVSVAALNPGYTRFYDYLLYKIVY